MLHYITIPIMKEINTWEHAFHLQMGHGNRSSIAVSIGYNLLVHYVIGQYTVTQFHYH